MNTVASLPTDDRRALFTETGVQMGLPPFHVEKDFWVCWVLAVAWLYKHGYWLPRCRRSAGLRPMLRIACLSRPAPSARRTCRRKP